MLAVLFSLGGGMRNFKLSVALLCLLMLSGCAASREEVLARLGEEYIGKNVDALVVKFGPPASTFKMNSGQTSYVWLLGNQTDIATDRGTGIAQTRFCKVSVIASGTGIIASLNTEDSNAGGGVAGALGAYGSLCANRLGIQRS
jgi:hypothetical protein